MERRDGTHDRRRWTDKYSGAIAVIAVVVSAIVLVALWAYRRVDSNFAAEARKLSVQLELCEILKDAAEHKAEVTEQQRHLDLSACPRSNQMFNR